MMKGNAEVTKALALLLWVKDRYVSSTINNFSYNRLHNLTGLHLNTIRKRIKTLKSLKLVRFEHNHLVFCTISSKSKYLSYDYKEIKCDTIMDFEKYLCSLQVVEIQRRKDFVKQTLQSLHAPDTLQEYRNAKRICRRYGYQGEYKEFGLSYKRIAKELGVSLQKAFDIVKFAVEKQILAKFKHQSQTYIRNAKFIVGKFLDDFNFTFCTKNNVYLVFANTYSVLD